MNNFKYVCKAKYNIIVENPIINGQLYKWNLFDAELNVCIGIDTTKTVPVYGVRLSLFDNNELTNIGRTEYTSTFKRIDWIAEEITDFLNEHCFISPDKFLFKSHLFLDQFSQNSSSCALYIGYFLKKLTFKIKVETLYCNEKLTV